MTDNGTVITAGLCRSLTESMRTANGWPLPSFLYKFAGSEEQHITVEQIMVQYSPEQWPGHYSRSICPVCHGQGDPECRHCGGEGQVCPRCRGYRWVYSGDDGRGQACTRCDTLKQQMAIQLASIWRDWGQTGYDWGIAPAEQGWTFANGLWHSPDSKRIPKIGKLRELAEWLEAWAKNPGYDGYNWIVLLGDYGVGKSYLATSAVHAAVEAGVLAYKWQTADLLNWLRAQQSPRADVDYAQWFRQLQFFPGVLVLDEFGHQRSTGFEHETLLTLLSYRGERAGLPTVIVGNLPLEQVRAQSPWLYSRFSLPEVLVPVLENFPDLRPLLKRG